MKRILIPLACLFVAVASVPALAQEGSTNTRSKPDGLVRSTAWSVYFNNYLYRFSNGDLRKTDNTSIQTVENTDDEFFIGYLELGAIFEANLAHGINFYVDLYRVGFWGNDSPEYVAANPVYFRTLNFSLGLFEGASLVVGRQRYSVNPDRAHHNYVLTDNIDAVLFSLDQKSWGVDIFADLFSMNSPVDAVYELHADRHSGTVKYFDGDVNIVRFAVVPFVKLFDDTDTSLTLKPYAMFARVGATGKNDGSQGGNENTSAGATGNHADNDWLALTGISAYARVSALSFLFEAGLSFGKDRKGPGVPDVDFSGYMLHASAVLKTGDLASFGAAVIYASGAETDADGNYKNYGYVSFKADKIGGYLFRDYYGVYPYGILSTSGIQIDPSESSKRSPMAGFMLRGSIDNLDLATFSKGKNGLDIDVEYWMYFDTSTSDANFSSTTLAADKFDQKRFGEFLGWELDLRIAWSIDSDVLTIGVETGFFVPGEFFAWPVANARAPFGNDTFWGVTVFSALKF